MEINENGKVNNVYIDKIKTNSSTIYEFRTLPLDTSHIYCIHTHNIYMYIVGMYIIDKICIGHFREERRDASGRHTDVAHR